MNCKEEKGKTLELKIRQIGEEGNSNMKTKENKKKSEIILKGM